MANASFFRLELPQGVVSETSLRVGGVRDFRRKTGVSRPGGVEDRHGRREDREVDARGARVLWRGESHDVVPYCALYMSCFIRAIHHVYCTAVVCMHCTVFFKTGEACFCTSISLHACVVQRAGCSGTTRSARPSDSPSFEMFARHTRGDKVANHRRSGVIRLHDVFMEF